MVRVENYKRKNECLHFEGFYKSSLASVTKGEIPHFSKVLSKVATDSSAMVGLYGIFGLGTKSVFSH